MHSAYGATFDRNMVHRAAFSANTVDAHSAYVAFSRAREGAAVYTENRASPAEAFRIRDGAQIGASNEAKKGPAVTTATPPVEVVGMAIDEQEVIYSSN